MDEMEIRTGENGLLRGICAAAGNDRTEKLHGESARGEGMTLSPKLSEADNSGEAAFPPKARPLGERVQQLKRLSGILIDRLEEAVEGKDFSVKDIRTYTNTLMDLRQIQMTDPELIAREQELKLIKLRREAGELGPRQLRISFEGEAEEASR